MGPATPGLPRCHLPIWAQTYPAALSASAMVISSGESVRQGSPTVKTPWRGVYLPLINEARVGAQLAAQVWASVKRTPSVARRSMFGVS